MRGGTLLLILVVGSASEAIAQDESQTAPAQKVRVTARGEFDGRVVGTVTDFSNGTLILRGTGRQSEYVWRIPAVSIQRLEVYRGKASRATGTGAVVGAVVGGAVGAASVAMVQESLSDFSGGTEYSAGPVAGFAVGAVVGALLGVAVGSLITTDRWETVTVGHLRVSIMPHSIRYGIGGRIAF